MFEHLDIGQQTIIFQALKSFIETGSGTDFHNADMGHPVYVAGSRGMPWELGTPPPDAPETNTLFRMLSELTNTLRDSGMEPEHYVWWYDFSTWQNFCTFAIDIYNRNQGRIND